MNTISLNKFCNLLINNEFETASFIVKKYPYFKTENNNQIVKAAIDSDKGLLHNLK